MRILAVALQGPGPLDHGGRLHVHHVLQQLARRADVTLAVPCSATIGEPLPPAVRFEAIPIRDENARRVRRRIRPPGLVECLARRHFGYSPAIEDWLRASAHAGRFDVVLLHGAPLGLYAHACRVPVVWDLADERVLPVVREARYASWRTWFAALRKATLYALYERSVARRTKATVVVSPVDGAFLRRWSGPARVEVIPNGVDFAHFCKSSESPVPGTVVFVGALDFPPNVDGVVQFATRVWPHVWALDPQRRFIIVGRRPVAVVRSLADRPGIELAPDVPDVRPYLRRTAVVVVPVRTGGGQKNKILEACAMGRPVVTSRSALGGMHARVGHDLLVADSPEEWIAQVNRLLARPQLAAAVAAHGHDWVRRNHTWSTTGQRYFDVLASVCGHSHQDSGPAPIRRTRARAMQLSAVP